MFETLLKAGADPNVREGKPGDTPLMYASEHGQKEIVRLLLAADVDPNIGNNSEVTPLMYASGRGHKEIVIMLLQAGADPNRMSKYEHTPLIWASSVWRKEIVEILLAAGADPDIGNQKERCKDTVKGDGYTENS